MARSVNSIALDVHMADGTVHRVEVDQRDFARWEASPMYGTDVPHTRLRHMAYTALHRQQLTTAKWPEFNDRLCVEAGEAVDEPADDTPLYPADYVPGEPAPWQG